MEKQKRILAIDYGDVRVGLAISDELGVIAQPIDTLVINNSKKKFLNEIKKIVENEKVGKIVIGYPKNMDGSNSKKTETIDEICEELSKQIDIEIVKWDERLTTVMAYNTMKELKITQKEKNKYADKIAAIHILEGYLNKMYNNY